jgi:hypothetical protein
MMRKKICLTLIFLISIFLNINLSTAIPYFFDILPRNNSYTFGRDSDIFSVNISETQLNTSSVYLHIRVYEPGSTLFNISLPCTNYASSEWYCYSTVPGFGSLASDGKNFTFHFSASDLSFNFNSSDNYFVTIDRSSTTISLTNIQNSSYISKNLKIFYTVTDFLSGVNQSSVLSYIEYVYGSETWNSSWFNMFLEEPYYTLTVDTSNFTNNGAVYIFTNASDILGNSNSIRYTFFVDDEPPQITIHNPSFNQTITGNFITQFNISDNLSGIDNSSIEVARTSVESSSCVGSSKSLSCSYTINSNDFNDGLFELTFLAKDLSNNTGENNTTILIDNDPPIITFLSPHADSTISGNFTVNTSIIDKGVGTDSAYFWWQSVFNSSRIGNMTPMVLQNGNYVVSWNTREVSDGNYFLNINATDKLGHSTNNSIKILVDNFRPTSTTSTTTGGAGSFVTTITQSTTASLATSTTAPQRNATKVSIFTKITQSNILPFALVISVVAIAIILFFFLRKKLFPPAFKYSYKPKF